MLKKAQTQANEASIKKATKYLLPATVFQKNIDESISWSDDFALF